MSVNASAYRTSLTVTLAASAMGFGLGATSAQATVYDWTYSNDSANIGPSSGQFTEISGVLTAISGTWGAATIGVLLAPGSYGGNDNHFPVTLSGITFTVGAGLAHSSTQVNFVYDAGYGWGGNGYGDCGCGGTFNATVHVAAVPEPASATILGAGLAGLLAAGRRRRRPATTAAA